MAYPIPPWLNVTPEAFGEAAYKGATIRMERARLAQQAQESMQRAGIAAAELSARAQAQQQANLREQQEMEISRAMHEAQIGLKTRELDQAEQEIGLESMKTQMSVEAATRKSAAQQEAAARIRAGEEPSKVWAELGPAIGLTGAGLAAAVKKPFQFRGAEPVPGRPDLDAIQTSTDQWRVLPKKPEVPESIKGVPVMDEEGNPIRGVFGTPNANGGITVHNIPQPTTGAAIDKLVEQRRQKQAGGGAQSGAPLPAKGGKEAAPKKARPFSSVPQKAKEYLVQHPESASDFDAKYGEGMAEIILGPGH